MKRVAATLFLLLGTWLCAAQTGKVEAIGPASDGIPDTVRNVLEITGHGIVLGDGSIACDLWLRRDVPVQPKKDLPDVLYSELAESTFVGVILFPNAGTDYRGQAIKSGAYTLRYELIPEDGNHLGVAANRDFLLLIPASADPDPTLTFKFDELVNLSRKASGTRHPAPLSLVQAGGENTLSKDEEEHWIFTTVLKLASGRNLPFALVVKGTAPQ